MNLPQEVLVEICRHISHKIDIQQIRLVNKAFAAAGKIFLVSKIQHLLPSRNLEALIYISNDPCMRKYVRHIKFNDIRCTSEYLDQNRWDEWWKWRCHGVDKFQSLHPSKHYWNLYQEVYNEDESSRQRGLDTAAFHLTLGRFPNLESVTFTDEYRTVDLEYFSIPPKEIFWLPEPVQWPWKTPLEDVCMWDSVTSPYQTFVVVIRALSFMRCNIRRLSIAGYFVGISHRLFMTSGPDLDHLYNVFQNLREVALHIWTYNNELLWEEAMRSGSLAKVLSKATLLQSLDLDFSQRDPPEGHTMATFRFSTGFGDLTWCHLRRLALTGMFVGHFDLTGFLIRHAGTLQDVKMHSLWLSTPSWSCWPILFSELHRHSVTWRSCKFTRLWDEHANYRSLPSEDVVEYLRSGGKNPCYGHSCWDRV
ncbi:hypothetical protein MMC12_003350 [Toensbergia leucococca]|nr:hypothetical protein [Toensbergia leucococca]